jgi:hypothetical protein
MHIFVKYSPLAGDVIKKSAGVLVLFKGCEKGDRTPESTYSHTCNVLMFNGVKRANVLGINVSPNLIILLEFVNIAVFWLSSSAKFKRELKHTHYISLLQYNY